MNDVADNREPVMMLAGAAPGFGEALVRAFIGAGYCVAGLSRSSGWGEALSAETAGAYSHHVCDLTDPSAVAGTVRVVTDTVGPPSVLVYNAMTLSVTQFGALQVEDFVRSWETTCLGAMILSRAVLPGMVQAGEGTLIFSGATASVRGGARFAAFASAKFALRGLAQALAREYGPKGVHVVHTLLDGLIWGPQTRARFDAARQDACLDPSGIATAYLQLCRQGRNAWTHELDMRPWQEEF